ncbi:MAG: TerD family protein [Rhizobiales bacterium]|nr:TerD family protein [Hyphomicrobiales bacterium]MBI3672952.1 TerD family protein [Hyphomicrobiales bacterium]
MLTLSLEKSGEPVQKLQLSLTKGARFTITVAWECGHGHLHDVDIHALEASNDGNGAKVGKLENILSTYNTKKMNPKAGVLPVNADGSFATPGGGLLHTGDRRSQGGSESIIVDGTQFADAVNEIPIFTTIHAAGEVETFEEIEMATITIAEDGGKELGSYRLSDEFKEFNVVQFGSIMRNDKGWEYAPVGRGFKGNFNDVLAQFT